MNKNKTTRETNERAPIFRAISRFVKLQNDWFFHSREGLLGPFDTKEEAEMELLMYIRELTLIDNFGLITNKKPD